MAMAQRHAGFDDVSAEVLGAITELLPVDALLHLEQTSCHMRELLRETVAQRCKRECFTTYLYPTIATYRMLAPVPETWKQLYFSFSKLGGMRWSVCQKEGTSSSLRSLKSDNQEYEVDDGARFLLRSGGHYWFSVWQTRVYDASLTTSSDAVVGGEGANANANSNSDAVPLAFLRSPRTISMGKWEKIRAVGQGPCPRRHHSMTCLPDTKCPASVISSSDATTQRGNGGDGEVTIRRVVFFGGQSEGIPFDAFNDLYLLGVKRKKDTAKSSGPIQARWILTIATGTPPSRRSGHITTLLSPTTLLISGGSDGTTPIKNLEVYLLRVEGYATFRWETPSSSISPSGRALHEVYRVASDEVIIFGGRQVIRQSNGLLSLHRLRILAREDDADAAACEAYWSVPETTGDPPHPRRGHSTNVLGDNLLLFGGQDMVTSQLENDVRVLHVPSLRWRRLELPGDAPCPRRGFKNQFFGTSLVISSGFVASPATGKMDQQLPDADIHVLTIV
uniref:Uncharacterized protein n=1 Tax=Globisporangium ultimum (strain ATCC 200006 / CBS 805.95 / DAOM BR144) TaxID=431595 RepID=K3WEL0_GLOUD